MGRQICRAFVSKELLMDRRANWTIATRSIRQCSQITGRPMWKLLSRGVSGFGTQGRNMGGDRLPTAIDLFAFYLQIFEYTQKALFDL